MSRTGLLNLSFVILTTLLSACAAGVGKTQVVVGTTVPPAVQSEVPTLMPTQQLPTSGGSAGCPDAAGIQGGYPLSKPEALDILNFLATGDDVERHSVTDPALWPILDSGFPAASPFSMDMLTDPKPASASPHAEELAALCGEDIVDISWWVRVCVGPCDLEASLDERHYYFLRRTDQWLLWRAITGAPQLDTPTPAPPSTPAAVETLVFEETAQWSTYRNLEWGYEIRYPEGAQVLLDEAGGVRIELPYTPGTQLEDKYASVTIEEVSAPSECFGLVSWEGVKVINGVEYHYFPGFKWESAMGGLNFFAADFHTVQGDRCYKLNFRLGVRDTTGFSDATALPPPPEADLDTEVFTKILSTFRLLDLVSGI